MLTLGLVSFSNHLKNKILPSIANNKKIIIKALTTKKKIIRKSYFKNKINIFNSKKKFFSKQFELIYISSENSNHYTDIKNSISNSKKIICEKPICTSTKKLKEIYRYAEKNKVKVFEMIQYIHHPLFVKLQDLIKKKVIGNIKYIESSFCVPIFYDKKNFRFSSKKGGGSLYDVGYYPISILFTLFKLKKIKLINKTIYKKKNVDINGKIILQDSLGRLFNLKWGLESNYENRLNLIGSKGAIYVDFIFSKKIYQKGLITLKKNNQVKKISIAKSNQINNAFNEIIRSDQKFYIYKKKLSLKILSFIERITKY